MTDDADRGGVTPGGVSADLLRDIRLFSGCQEVHLVLLAALARRERVAAGKRIIAEDDPAREVRVVLSGRVKLTLEAPGQPGVPVSTLSPGEMLGWSALLHERTWVATAHALKDCEFLVFPAAALFAACQLDTALGHILMRNALVTVSHRLHDARLQLMDMYRRE